MGLALVNPPTTRRQIPMTRTRRGYDTRSFDTLEYIAHAERARCPICEAEPHTPCLNPHTGHPLRVPHWQRKKAADHLEAT